MGSCEMLISTGNKFMDYKYDIYYFSELWNEKFTGLRS